MPKIGYKPPPTNADLFDTNGVGTPKPEYTFNSYGFVARNVAKMSEHPLCPTAPDLVVEWLEYDSIKSSIGGVLDWHKRTCPTQAGMVVRIQTKAIEEQQVEALEAKSGKQGRKS